MTGVRAVSLFSGSGAGDLGLSRAGIGTILQAEPNADCVDVLSVHYPDVFRVPDVRDLATLTPPHECPCECDEPWCERHGDHYFECPCLGLMQEEMEPYLEPDIIIGGFPCTDISSAKDRWGAAGVAGDASGLWFDFLRCIESMGPRWVIVENTGRLRNGRGGADLRTVVGGLNEAGYLGVGCVLDAAAFGLPARRPRTYLVARRSGDARSLSDLDRLARSFLRYDPGCVVLEGTRQPLATNDGAARPEPGSFRLFTPRECERLVGLPDDWTRYRPDGTELSAGARRRLCGNAMAVPVVEFIGKLILRVELEMAS